MDKKFNFEFVQKYFEEQGCQLLDNQWRGNRHKMSYICSCGNKSEIAWRHFREGMRCGCGYSRCAEHKKPTFEFVKNYFKEHGCELLEDHYVGAFAPMSYICNCGNKSKTNWSRFGQGCRCKICGHKRSAHRLDSNFVKQCFLMNDCVLLDEYVNNQIRMKYICSCGREAYVRFGNFQTGQRCKKCAADSIKGENHPHWNPNRELVKLNKIIKAKSYSMLRSSLRAIGKKKEAHSFQLLGYTTQQLKNRIITHPNWEKIKNKKWHLDHIFPIKAFVEYGIIDLKIINALDNLQPLGQKENLSKNARYSKKDFKKWLKLKGIVI